jgi:hypothetical protein
MVWKEFLKPNWKKISLAVVFFLFFPVFFPWLGDACPEYETMLGLGQPPCNDIELRISTGWVINAIIDETQRTPQWNPAPFEVRSLPAMWYPEYYIYHIIITYLLSCLVIFIYNKFKKSKGNKL